MINSRPIIILGAGGHAKVLAEALKLSGESIIGLVSPDEKNDAVCFGLSVLGDDGVIATYSPNEVFLVNGIGALPSEKLRWRLAAGMRHQGYCFKTVIHPSAVIAEDVVLSEGVQIMAGVVIQSNTKVARDSIVNTGSLIDHDCCIGNNCHIAPGVTICGGVNIKDGVHIGAGSTLIQHISVGENSIVAAGSVIYKNLLGNSTYIQAIS